MTRQLPPAGRTGLRSRDRPCLAPRPAWSWSSPRRRPRPVPLRARSATGRASSAGLPDPAEPGRRRPVEADRRRRRAARASAASSATRGRTTRTARRPSSSAAPTATAATPRPTVKEFAHVQPRFPEAWRTSANPVRSYTLLNHESPEFTMFVNPGDLRVAHISCGTSGCHPDEVDNNRKSMMTHGRMLWEAALYNNGAFPLKRARYGESYSMNGVPQMIVANPPPTEEDTRLRGELPFLMPLPQVRDQPAGQHPPDLRARRHGSAPRSASPNTLADPRAGPRVRLSDRGLGTENRTDPVYIGLPEDPAARPDPELPGHQRPRRATTGPAAAPPATSCTPTTARRSTPGPTPSTATAGPASASTRPSPRTSRATRSTTGSSPRRPRASASSATSTPAPTS